MTGWADRASSLPPAAECYRKLGPFDAQTLPEGLTREHRLKEGVWGLLLLREGSVRFVWDDEAGGEAQLSAPAEMIIPPTVPHHLRLDGQLAVEIHFHREPGAA